MLVLMARASIVQTSRMGVPMSAVNTSIAAVLRPGVLRRFAVYLALWLVLIGFNVSDLAIGVITAACATWVSVALLPVSDRHISPAAFGRLAIRLALAIASGRCGRPRGVRSTRAYSCSLA